MTILSFSKYNRIIHYLENSKDLTKEELEKRLHHTGVKLRYLETIRIIFFILLYSSIVSGILSIFPGFELISKNILKISSLFSSTICIILIAITTKAISIYTTDLNLIASHLIVKNDRRTKLRNKKI